MKRITITLTDEEYATLKQQAQQERRTLSAQAVHLIVQRPMLLEQPKPLVYQPWTITSGDDSISRCGCGQSGSHLCALWNSNTISGDPSVLRQ